MKFSENIRLKNNSLNYLFTFDEIIRKKQREDCPIITPEHFKTEEHNENNLGNEGIQYRMDAQFKLLKIRVPKKYSEEKVL